LLSGGVSANRLLREKLEISLAQSLPKVIFSKPDLLYTADNAAMIGLAGYLNFANKKTASSWKTVVVDANLGF
jgi:tRNA A37 threonylcarbamoyltransferase TsaD